MTKAERAARKRVGLPKFRRECRSEQFGGHLTKRYAIPGTREAGKLAMLNRTVSDMMKDMPCHD